MKNKSYKSIKEVSKLLNIKEHVIRHWDSIDPKTNKIRIPGLSTRSRSGIRYFNEENIKKLEQIKNVLFDNGKHNYSLDLANKLIKNKKYKNIETSNVNNIKKNEKNLDSQLYDRLDLIRNKLKNLAEI
tara:strand:- start:36 stop:422 length:387 start_codon:yes stop_codon:yes gene_type:complete